MQWLSKEEVDPWLLVLDNSDDIEMFFGPVSRASEMEGPAASFIADLIPRNLNGSIIITTRDTRVGQRLADGEEIRIAPFPPLDAEQLLRVRIALNDNVNTADIQNLLDTLGFIPLAISQAAAFIRENGMTVATYIRAIKTSDEDLQDYLDEDLPDPRRDPGSENSVIRTWKLSFDQIAKQMPRAAELLSLMAMLDRQGIPEILLRQESERSILFNKALGTLLSFSLVTMEKGEYYEVHRLVQLSTQKWLALQGTQNEWQEKALELMARNFPSGEHETWQACEVLYPHALTALRCSHPSKIMLLQRAKLLQNLATYDEVQGRYNIASPRCREVLQVREQALGKEHPDTLTSMNNLALVLDSQGKFSEAEEIHQQTLQLSEKALGKEHPDTLTSMNNLASVLHSQGKFSEAEEIHRQTLQLREKVLGKEHPGTLASMNNLASVLRSQGKFSEAEEIYRQELQLCEKVLGKEHPDTLVSLFNLASTLMGLGNVSAAEALFQLELERCEIVYGLEHSQTVASRRNLVSLLEKRGNSVEAETT